MERLIRDKRTAWRVHSSDEPRGGGVGRGDQDCKVSTVVIRWNEGGAVTPPHGDQRHWWASPAPSALSSCANLYGGANPLTLQQRGGAGRGGVGGEVD